MIAEAIKKGIHTELAKCVTKQDVRRIFADAQRSFNERNVPHERRNEVLKELRPMLKQIIDNETDPRSTVLVVEAQLAIDTLLIANVGKPGMA